MARNKGYRYIDHTADVEFVATGKSTEEMFKNSMLAQFEIISEIGKVATSKAEPTEIAIEDRADSLEELLWRVLQDSLSNADAAGVFAYGVARISIKKGKDGYSCNAAIVCKEKDAAVSKFDVKGVSRFDLKIRTSKGVSTASVVLDV